MHRLARRRSLIALTGPGMSYLGPARRDAPGDGGSGDGGGSGGGNTGGNAGGSTGSTGGAEGGAGKGNTAGGDQGADGEKRPKIEGEFDKDRYERTLGAAREAERAAKAEAKAERDRVAAILKAAGLTPDGKKDPEQQLAELQAKAEAAETRVRLLATREAVRTAAGKHGAAADALLDSREVAAKIDTLDPGAADFDDKVADVVKEFAKQDRFKGAASTGTRRIGAPIAGGAGGSNQDGRPASIKEALARRNA